MILISYDVARERQTQFKAEMVARGYVDRIPVQGQTKLLPESTLMKPGTSLTGVKEEIQAAALAAGTTVEKSILVTTSGFDFYP